MNHNDGVRTGSGVHESDETDSRARGRAWWLREAGGMAAAVLMALIVVDHLASSPRSVLLFSDGDSLLTVLVAHSLQSGQPQDWAMSSVLFIPEILVYLAVSALGLPVMATLLVVAVLTLLVVYAALRLVAGAATAGLVPVIAALTAFGAFAGVALLESSASRESLELASLTATTTYYSATVVGVLVTVGLMLRVLGSPRITPGPLGALFLIAAVSTLSNPLYIAWAAVPLLVVLGVVAAPRLVSRTAAVTVALALLGGASTGMLLRVPLASIIANDGVGYARPERWVESLAYYGGLVAARAETLPGAIALVAIVVLELTAVVATVLAVRRREGTLATIATAAWVVPLVVVLGAVALGTHAARYLQPAVFMPVLGLVAVAGLLSRRRRASRVLDRRVVVALALSSALAAHLLISTTVGTIPRYVAAATVAYPDSSVACVVSWVEQSTGTGAGQFWSVRAPKAYLDDPARLVQVDASLNAYAWLVNRADFAPGAVSFLVSDGQSPGFSLPGGLSLDSATSTQCGRYTIWDFGTRQIPLGPEHS